MGQCVTISVGNTNDALTSAASPANNINVGAEEEEEEEEMGCMPAACAGICL